MRQRCCLDLTVFFYETVFKYLLHEEGDGCISRSFWWLIYLPWYWCENIYWNNISCSKRCNLYFITLHSLHLFSIVSSWVAAVASLYSVWGPRFQPWHGSCICISFKKLNHIIIVKMGSELFLTLLSWPLFISVTSSSEQ